MMNVTMMYSIKIKVKMLEVLYPQVSKCTKFDIVDNLLSTLMSQPHSSAISWPSKSTNAKHTHTQSHHKKKSGYIGMSNRRI